MHKERKDEEKEEEEKEESMVAKIEEMRKIWNKERGNKSRNDFSDRAIEPVWEILKGHTL